MSKLAYPAIAAAVALNCLTAPAHAEIVGSNQRPSTDVSVRSLADDSGTVTGVVVNDSPHRVQDVKLLIRHSWLWNNEYSPGHDDPGRAVLYTLPEELPAGASVQFTYRPDPGLPSRSDGRFLTSASVASFKVYE